MKQSEVWKDIQGYEGLYQVSSYGKIRSIDRSGEGKPGVTKITRIVIHQIIPLKI
jgi:hypothetical protein